MNHDIVVDRNGNEHQAVKFAGYDRVCDYCSLQGLGLCNDTPCMTIQRSDEASVIYKRKVTIKEYINER